MQKQVKEKRKATDAAGRMKAALHNKGGLYQLCHITAAAKCTEHACSIDRTTEALLLPGPG